MEIHKVTQLLDQTETAPVVGLSGTHIVPFLIHAAATGPCILSHSFPFSQ